MPCFNSTRHRSLHCVYQSQYVEPYQCKDMPKPKEIEVCEHVECPIWSTGEWSICSASCGKGMQTRYVNCVIEKNKSNRRIRDKSGIITEIIDKNRCDPLKEPSNTTECVASKPCPEWRFTQWTSCSVNCGKGYRMRYVYCTDRESPGCSLMTKPVNSEVCNMPACTYSWKVDDWSEVC